MWRDPDVRVSPGLEQAAERFAQRGQWRTSGYSPFVLQFHRTPTAPERLPFATWQVHADWMPPGKFIEMMTPREMPKALGLAIAPWNATGPAGRHANGARRLTGVRVAVPTDDALPPAVQYLTNTRSALIGASGRWLLQLTFDERRLSQTRDLRPTLPLIVRY